MRVIDIANMIITIGSNVSIAQPAPLNPIVAIRPTRALCAVDIIIIRIGAAATKPIAAASALIFATMICICRVIKLSDAPTWFKI